MIADAHWRRGASGRESIAAPGDSTSIAKAYTPVQQAWGKVTSREPDSSSRAALELAAFRLGVKPSTLKQAIAMGVFSNG